MSSKTNVIIGASNDETGNIKYGGDWVLESTNEDISNIYFNGNIVNYSSTLVALTITNSGGTIYLNQDSSGNIDYSNDNTIWFNISASSWPVTITNSDTFGNVLTVKFNNNLNFSSAIVGGVNGYFICGSKYITFDGFKNTVTIDDIINYPGLIQNGTENTDAYSNITIQNIGVLKTINSHLNFFAGWIGQLYFGKNTINCNINNCYSTGDVIYFGGGIVGGFSSGTVTNCYSTGNISGVSAGGIFGKLSSGTTTNCYSTGNISGNYAGGIVGDYSSGTIINCYSTGNISGIGAGGICGEAFGYLTTNCSVSNCYSTENITGNCYSNGVISGINAGGICGAFIGATEGNYVANVSITNCFSLGQTSNDSGSICGGNKTGNMYTDTPNAIIQNCYSLYGPLISASLPITITPTTSNVASTPGTWIDGEAGAYLINIPIYIESVLNNPIGSVWADYAPTNSNTPWIFSTFRYSPYTTTLTTTYSQTITKGQSTNGAIDPSGHTYQIIAINSKLPSVYPTMTINSLGQIVTTNETVAGVYNIKVRQNSNYSMTNFTLTLNGSGIVVTPTTIDGVIFTNTDNALDVYNNLLLIKNSLDSMMTKKNIFN